MKTVIVTCDRCLTIINKIEVLTGTKYLPTYIKYELNCGGVLKEFCSMHCMELQIHTGENTINKEELGGVTLLADPPMPSEISPTLDNPKPGDSPIGFLK